ncbi:MULTISPECIES: VOC family protein [unclassified Iodidimonas]|jgi:catechol 2,3-dioxygenase-like lactoylglutathione lyase family enzyme|uniref:VOC family protein n=2 Tax=Iodidimonas TaxID=2066486 RepID=UPI0024825AC0|nr:MULTISPECIES: VOC family protein [unclassified Iodidimonas]
MMSAPLETATNPKDFKLKTRGLHHAAYLTKDMDKTIDFYHNLLNMPLVVTLALPEPDPFAGEIPVRGDVAGTRHYFFDCGQGASLAFFSWNESFGDIDPDLGVMHHISLNVETVDELYALKEKLEAHGISVTKVIDHFFCKSIYFRDPNGLYLEYSSSTIEYHEDKPFLEDPEPLDEAVKALGNKLSDYKTQFREGHNFVDPNNKKH